ncbi:hypothetical protein J25TS5_01720 [Paenibacillus faecis]|nr:hypothetical protein J25TS5_01720 [Paenibacillus faecis]
MERSEDIVTNNALSVLAYIIIQVAGDVILFYYSNQTVVFYLVTGVSLIIYLIIGFTVLKNNRTYLSDYFSVSTIAIVGISIWLLFFFSYVSDSSGFMPDLIWALYAYYNNLSMIVMIRESEFEYYYVIMLLLNLVPSFMFWLGLSLKRYYMNYRRGMK